MAEITPRYEFRIWADALAGLRDKLEQRTAPSRAETSNETYLISAATDRCNAKIRNHLMDIKLLVGTHRGLEQWKPVLKADFPLDQSVIAAQVFPHLELAAPPLSRPRYAMEEFLTEVMQTHPQIAVVKVSKRRLQFGVDGCQAEFASTTIDSLTRETVAVESTESEAVLELIRALGIDGVPNTSYIREIKQLLGK
jgi:exopolyphosphatase / guanosine-5'-triphosphate,3'-diphosphate pyrophosphatase